MKNDVSSDNPSRTWSDLACPRFEWMNSAQYVQHLSQRGEIRSGSKKRTSSQMTRDEEADDDAYTERRGRRRESIDSADAHLVLLDPYKRQLEEATRWYEECGRYASVDFPPDSWEDVAGPECGRANHRERRYRKHPPRGKLSPSVKSNSLSCASDEVILG